MLGKRGMKVSCSKTKCMCVNERELNSEVTGSRVGTRRDYRQGGVGGESVRIEL